MTESVRIIAAHTPEHIPAIKTLFLAYANSLNFSLCFQGFDEELESLPGKYAPPHGKLLAALVDGAYAGCVALRPLEPGVCEMKRLYVLDEFRNLKLGRRLAIAIVVAGRELGYRKMRLDTVPIMERAIALYRSLGFVEVAPYRENPVEGALFMECDLGAFDLQRFA